MSGRTYPPPLERFNAKVRKDPNGCWIWIAAKDRYGYGVFMPDARRTGKRFLARAHRWAYEHFVGPLDGRHLHHKCETRACVNPAHLDAVSQAFHNVAIHPRERDERTGRFVRAA